MPTHLASVVQLMVFTIGAVALLAMLAWPQLRRRFDGQQVRIVVWIAIGVAANAAICGIFSEPADRYEARVAWLIPFVMMTAVLGLMDAVAAASSGLMTREGRAAATNPTG
jgi:hypothetical protein